MPINLIIATESLEPPLTGIGYYTAHLVDELLRSPDIERLRGLDHHGLSDATALSTRLQKLTQGELGQVPGTEPIGAQSTTAAAPASQRFDRRRALKDAVKKVPGAYTLARHWYAHRHRTAMARAMAAERNIPWLLHAPNYIPPKHKGPTVITVHDLSHLRHPETHPKERIDWLNQSLPKAIAQAAKIISVSEFTKQELLDLGLVADPDKIAVCYNGLDASFCPRADGEIAAELHNWGLQRGRYILSVATLEPRKNMERLLEAYEALPEHLAREYPLVLIGAAGWKNSSLRQRIARIKPPRQVITTGYLDRTPMQHLLSGAGVFAYLSFYEGFGLPVAEAMASGTPVLTANTGALREVAGDGAHLVDPHDVQDIRAGMTLLLEDLAVADRYRSAGLTRASEFSWQRCARETVAVYREVMAAVEGKPKLDKL